MTDARRGLFWLRLAGALTALAIVAVLGGLAVWLERRYEAALPRLNGQPSPLREALRFPRPDFPTILDVERDELRKLIPLARPIRLSEIPPWTTIPNAPSLGASSARNNQAFVQAIAIMRRIDEARRAGEEPGSDERRQLEQARERLTAAENESTQAMQWLIHYNRGVLYNWQANRQRAAREFQRAYENLKFRMEHGPVDEARVAAVHALYGWGDALIQEAESGGTVVPAEAVDRLRAALIEATTLYETAHPSGVGHPAVFRPVGENGLSTRALRNDLLAAYLDAPEYSRCNGEPMAPDVCTTRRYAGPCRYRDKKFCETKASNELAGVYAAELEKFKKGEIREGTFWALQNAAELEAENTISDDPEVSYNVAHLLLELKRPELAHKYVSEAIQQSDQRRVNEKVAQLAFVTSILSGQKLGARASSKVPPASQPGEFRHAYDTLYPDETEPPPFDPIVLDDDRKGKSLDAWLFIRRYRYLLSRGQFEQFIAEHRSLVAMNVPHDFLNAWKSAVVTELLRNAAAARERAQPETKAAINELLARRDLFTSDELKAASLTRPWSWWSLRWVFYVVAVAAALFVIAFYFWLCRAYAATFISAYQWDRGAQGERPPQQGIR